MAKFFPKLNQRQVRIELCEGKSVMVDMLPISALSRLGDFCEALDKATTRKEIEAIQAKMAELAATVIPEEFSYNLKRFTVNMLGELLAYLAYGDNNDLAAEDPEPKN